MPYSKAHVVLDAVRHATEADITALGELAATNAGTLQLELVLRILLTYLPESTPPSSYVLFLETLISGKISDRMSDDLEGASTISIDEAKRRVRRLKLDSLDHPGISLDPSDLFERFLLCRAYRIDSEIGSVSLIQDLVKPFSQGHNGIDEWAVSTILPLQRLEEQTALESGIISLSHLQQLYGRSGLQTILASLQTERGADSSSNLRNIIGPWMFGQIIRLQYEKHSTVDTFANAATESWSIVNEWLLQLATTDYESAVNTFIHWRGPADIDYGDWIEPPTSTTLQAATAGYLQAGLALAYTSPDSASRSQIAELIRVVAERAGFELPQELSLTTYLTYESTIPDVFLASISNLHLTSGELLDGANPLTTPSNYSVLYALLISISSNVLDSLGIVLTFERTANLALFDSASNHWSICSKVIHNLPTICGKDDKAWMQALEKLMWLHGWNTQVKPGQVRYGIFSQVDPEEIHNAYLEGLVTHGRYKLAIALYCTPKSRLPASRVKDALINVILTSYDNASNGNKTRGGIKKAAEIITTFQSQFPGFQRLAAIWALIQATHRLSFYSLTLQHGVPLLPVNIRIHPEPLTFIDKVLEQNPRSYTKLDDLLDIGRDLVKAGRIVLKSTSNEPLPQEETIHQVEQSITAKAISASLSEDDFDTAYSYIVSRLSNMSSSDASSNDHLWRAAYQAGRYSTTTTSSTSTSSLRRLEQRMELLSQALLLAPTPALQEVLSTWRQCEQDLNSALAQESREEDAWQAKGDRVLPGGFSREDIAPVQKKAREHTRRAMDEEAPMGLFDVARGAAAALSKSAFPLRAQAERSSGETVRSDEDTTQRVRKRDMVSNMVTGGLASGIGWVIGAQPVNHDN